MSHYTVKPCREIFHRCGYEVQIYNSNGSVRSIAFRVHGTDRMFSDTAPVRFWGNDGRKVRAEAIRWAKSQIN